jgi:PAS domain-containing protein
MDPAPESPRRAAPPAAPAAATGGEAVRAPPAEALAEATRLVAEASDDLGATLDALAEQARRLLGADDVGIHLTAPDGAGFLRRRTHRLARPGSPAAEPGTRVVPDAFLREMMATRRPVFTADFRGDPRIDPASKPNAPTARALLAVPLVAADALVGVLFALWDRPHAPTTADLDAAAALGRHAATAVRTAGLLEEARTARTRLAGYLDAADDAIVVYAPDGRLLRANPAAEAHFRALLGRVPSTGAEARLAVPAPSDAGAAAEMFARACAGEPAASEFTAGDRRFHVAATPVRGRSGRVDEVVMIARDITDLRRAITREARLDGALKTARLAAHELNNRLQFLAGYGRLLPTLDPAEATQVAAEMADTAMEAGALLNRMQRILRFEEITIGGQTVLDLDASTDGGEG